MQNSEPPAPPASVRPTNIRWIILLLTTLTSLLLYLHRIFLSFAERYIKEDLRVDDQSMAIVLSSFFWAYALGQVPAGSLSDRFGARIMLTLYVAGWSAFTGILGLAAGLTWLILLRLGCGLFQAGAYPSAASLIGRWMPYARRGLASGIVAVGGRIGGAAAPVLTAFLMIALVPVSVPSRFQESDLLFTPALLGRLDDSGDLPADALGRHVKNLFSSETVEVVHRARFLVPVDLEDPRGLDHYLDGIEHVLRDPASAATAILNPGDPVLIAALVDGLNQAIAAEKLIFSVDLTKFDLPAEAVRLATPGARPPEEIERRNRLLLEAAFPDAVRKIYGNGWRSVALIYGIVGLFVALLFWWYYRDSPRLHPKCNTEEIALIEGTPAATSPGPGVAIQEGMKEQPFPWRSLLTHRSLWLMSIVQFLTNVSWVFLITWMPRFLVERFQVPVVERGWMTGLPIFVGMFGMFSGGWLTDYLVQRLGRRWGRVLAVGITRFCMGFALLACAYLNAPWPVAVALSVFAFSTDLGTPSIWAYSLDVGGKHVGAVLGWGNMWGNLGAAVSPLFINAVESRYGWDGVFLSCAALMMLAGVLALLVDARKPVVEGT